jgi:hypothetical protein
MARPPQNDRPLDESIGTTASGLPDEAVGPDDPELDEIDLDGFGDEVRRRPPAPPPADEPR